MLRGVNFCETTDIKIICKFSFLFLLNIVASGFLFKWILIYESLFKIIGFLLMKKMVLIVEHGIKLSTELAVSIVIAVLFTIFPLCRMECLPCAGVWKLCCLVRLDVNLF